MINFNVGYSGYEGWFVALGYSTQNFLGMGETFLPATAAGYHRQNIPVRFYRTLLVQFPGQLRYRYFQDLLPIPQSVYPQGEGFNISSSTRFWKFWGTSLIYSWQNIAISDVNESLYGEFLLFLFIFRRQKVISAISPTIYYSTVDSPIFPQSGNKFLVSYRYAGGFLGGDLFSAQAEIGICQIPALVAEPCSRLARGL